MKRALVALLAFFVVGSALGQSPEPARIRISIVNPASVTPALSVRVFRPQSVMEFWFHHRVNFPCWNLTAKFPERRFCLTSSRGFLQTRSGWTDLYEALLWKAVLREVKFQNRTTFNPTRRRL